MHKKTFLYGSLCEIYRTVVNMNRFTDLYSVFRRRANAVAFINGSEKYPDIQGRVLLYQLRRGVVVRTEIINLPKAAELCKSPVFAFHIHSGSKCEGNSEDPFADVGAHYNPDDCPHPYHAGDLPPLFSADGRALSACLSDRFTVSEIIGRTVIIHLLPDDFTTQPSGNAGEKIACGVIKPTVWRR